MELETGTLCSVSVERSCQCEKGCRTTVNDADVKSAVLLSSVVAIAIQANLSMDHTHSQIWTHLVACWMRVKSSFTSRAAVRCRCSYRR
jgi:hypothetical protein